MSATGIEKPAPGRRRLTILAGMALFLAPFAAIPQMAGEVNLCGAVCPRMFFIFSPAGILSGFGSGLRAEWFGAALVGLILLATFFAGRLWCSRLCPVGGTTELVSRGLPAGFKLSFSTLHAPAFRYAYLFVFVTGAWLGIGSIACTLCNFRIIPFLAGAPFVPAYRTYLSSSVGLAGLLFVAATGFFAKGGRAYCNLLCPVGALDGAVNFLSEKWGFTRKVRMDPARCSGCGKCVGACMVWALELEAGGTIRRDQTSCMSCRECVKVCPREAIRYGGS